MLFYDLHCKETFNHQLLTLPVAEVSLVRDKVRQLVQNPAPDAKNKKQLDHVDGRIFRIRSGDYRVLYTYGDGRVSLLGVGHRSTIYKGINERARRALASQAAELPIGLATERSDDAKSDPMPMQAANRTLTRHGRSGLDYFERTPGTKSRSVDGPSPLPQRLDEAFLRQLRVSDTAIPALMTCATIEDLCAAPISEKDRGRVFDAVVTPDFLQVLAQPDFRLDSPEDIQRLFDGDLVATLLRLDPEQEKLTKWGNATGPTLFRGGPGTGKSVVAIYRVRSLVEQLRRAGNDEPRILFTSYNKSLTGAARELLKTLLGFDADFVDVRTTDSVVSHLYWMNGRDSRYDDDDNHRMLHVGRAKDRLRGQEATADQMRSIEKLPFPYLVEEIEQVIVARDIETELEYLTEPRAGRRIRLNDNQQRAIWLIHELREEMTFRERQRTIGQWRRDALRGLRSGWHKEKYDAVIIDEAQDLDPTVIRILRDLVDSSDRLCLTADSNQCIYGNGFRWQDVHQDLKFRGRATVLRRSYRSTQQIVDAANAFLHGAEGDEGVSDLTHVRVGPKPAVLRLEAGGDAVELLAAYLREAMRALRVGLSSCAVLIDGRPTGMALEAKLADLGIASRFTARSELDLNSPEVKITTMHSAKGLEFPIVAILPPARLFSSATASGVSNESEEQRVINRRLMYVAMTRAMYALTVILPGVAPAELDDEFPEQRWQRGQPTSWATWLGGISVV